VSSRSLKTTHGLDGQHEYFFLILSLAFTPSPTKKLEYPTTFHNLLLDLYRLEEPIMEMLYGVKKRCSRVRLYNAAESERIWMKSGRLSTLLVARDSRSSDSLRGSLIFGQISNARFRRFPVGQISLNFNRTTSIGVAM